MATFYFEIPVLLQLIRLLPYMPVINYPINGYRKSVIINHLLSQINCYHKSTPQTSQHCSLLLSYTHTHIMYIYKGSEKGVGKMAKDTATCVVLQKKQSFVCHGYQYHNACGSDHNTAQYYTTRNIARQWYEMIIYMKFELVEKTCFAPKGKPLEAIFNRTM